MKFFDIRHLQNYSLRTKIIVGSLLVELVSIGVVAYIGFTRASQIVDTVSGRFEKSVQSLNETELKNIVKSESAEANQVFLSTQNSVLQVANYRVSLYSQTATLGSGGYWDARRELVQLGGGRYDTPPTSQFNLFINNTIKLTDSLIQELNAGAYLDFIVPSILEANPNIIAVYYNNKEGVIHYYPKSDFSTVPPDYDVHEGVFYYSATPEKDPEKTPVWTPPYQDPAGRGMVVSVSAPVYTKEGVFKGVVGIDMQLGRVSENISQIKIGSSGFAFLVDKIGRIIVMPTDKYALFGLQPEQVPLDESPKETILGHGSKDFQEVTKLLVNGESGLSKIDINGVENYIVYTPLVTPGYSLGVIVPVSELNTAIVASREEVQSETRSFLQISILILIGLLLGTVLLSIGTSRVIVAPLVRLTQTAERISSGDLSARAAITSQDETATLANAFNSMTARLSATLNGLEQTVTARTRDLEIAIGVSKQITQVLRLDELLPKLVENTRNGFDLYFVSVYLYDSDMRQLVLSAGTGEAGKQMKDEGKVYDLNARPGIVAQAGREQRAVVIGDVTQSQTYFVNPYLPETRSEAAIPMIVQGELVGVMGVQSKEVDGFQEEDVRILTSLAEQIGVAVQNARLYEEQLLVADELKRVDQMKSQFLSSMSHELRTPLNAIINFVEMIARGLIGPITKEQEELLDQALNSSKHLLHLINDVLDISKIQAGRLTLFIEEQVDLQEEVEAVLNIISGLAQEKDLQVIRDIDPDLPKVACDRRRMRQVLLNLMSNAIKFTGQGTTVTISAKNHGEEVLFAVIDMGPGVAPAMQALIFEPFMQVEDNGRQREGTGLGLSISHSLVRAHGGELWVESEDGEGASFFFTLPTNGRVAQ